ncbi:MULTISPECIES: GNAT family N-acetyltransferase [Streptomyces]|uniref:Acetyltransferase (GNAT) family protein n=1 Tax=Streptomyces rimosus subsp. rimosus TaxID=132474 RepID=A0ABY3YWG1_STRRM|nr:MULTISPECIES: GNAT family N-acetyltransferase [Streptomyces]KOG71185.1 acetyltransferase [Kitasatospora aureofaciens]KEF03648.1 acetyltransferase [Streptomyces rimosus]KUJ32401.1 acetyltransferase [Streptomyces rimosus subsp. rimosus]UNZ00579.1 Acetyltransferase (GNAT) family protein [Streptomyces rimosus subsp. rimosus]UTH92563.1 Acetyltransferase (GNAT) family protein [Streptomyces rimosus subsp. rimosus]
MTDCAESIESVEQLATAWRTLVLDRDTDADVRDLPGIAVRWVDSRFSFWNCLALTDVGAGAELVRHRLNQAADIMRAKKHPGYLWLFEDLLDDEARSVFRTAAERAGLRYAFPGTGMAGDLLPVPDPVHPDLTFVRVSTDEQLQAYADLNSRAYGFPLEDGREGLVGSMLWKSEVYAYLALRGDTPVACAATLEADGRLFVAFVATDPQWQRRGYGEAVTRKALYEGHQATGLTRATLHATAAGAPVYPRIGFKPNSPIHFYNVEN